MHRKRTLRVRIRRRMRHLPSHPSLRHTVPPPCADWRIFVQQAPQGPNERTEAIACVF